MCVVTCHVNALRVQSSDPWGLDIPEDVDSLYHPTSFKDVTPDRRHDMCLSLTLQFTLSICLYYGHEVSADAFYFQVVVQVTDYGIHA